ncbi:hypothetical protein CONPUDRAFT_162986, partial [Coniophora puteana RWD-64-598 SS2]
MEDGDDRDMWWWTIEGLRFAKRASALPDADALVQVTNAETGVVSFKPAAAMRDPKAPVVPDSQLSFEDLSFASTHMITAMRNHHWEKERVDQLYEFWRVLLGHPWWYSLDGSQLYRNALLAYQEDSRKDWHFALRAKSGYRLEFSEDDLKLARESLFFRVKNSYGGEYTNSTTAPYGRANREEKRRATSPDPS